MLDKSVVSAGLKLNELARLESGTGIILQTLKAAGTDPKQGVTFSDLYDAVQTHLPERLALHAVVEKEEVVARLLTYLRDYQSVFTMAAQ